tara:strand:- start:347 stop:508 length:162 start_codon:yes stop_codon:yes gene_type:complete
MEIKLTETDLRAMPRYLKEGLIMYAEGIHPQMEIQHDMATIIAIVKNWEGVKK